MTPLGEGKMKVDESLPPDKWLEEAQHLIRERDRGLYNVFPALNGGDSH